MVRIVQNLDKRFQTWTSLVVKQTKNSNYNLNHWNYNLTYPITSENKFKLHIAYIHASPIWFNPNK